MECISANVYGPLRCLAALGVSHYTSADTFCASKLRPFGSVRISVGHVDVEVKLELVNRP